MAEGRGGTWGPGPAATNTGPGSYERHEQGAGEMLAPTYDMVVSEKDASLKDPQDPHFLGQLMPVAHSRSDETRSFFDATSITG